MSLKKEKLKWRILAIIAGVVTAGILYWVFDVNENPIYPILVVCLSPILWIFTDWSVSRDMPNLDDHKNLGDIAEVTEDFEKVGNEFEGSIKLNGVKWKARNRSSSLKAGTVVKTISLDNLTYEVEQIEKH